MSTITISAELSVPTDREKLLRFELETLPDVSVESLPGWSQYTEACTRLAAAEAVAHEQRVALTVASAKMRAYVAQNWAAKEVGSGVRALLNVF